MEMVVLICVGLSQDGPAEFGTLELKGDAGEFA